MGDTHRTSFHRSAFDIKFWNPKNSEILWVSNSELLNFADDNIIRAGENTIEELISTLEKESQTAID